MKRKINRVGQNTLTVSLPSKWVKTKGLKAGQEIDVEEDGSNLVIISSSASRKKKKARINLDNFNKMLINRFLTEFYRQGVEEIVLTHSKDTFPDYKNNREKSIDNHINKVAERFIGMEIVSQTNNKIILQSLVSKEEWKKLDIIEQRWYFLIKDFLEEFIKAMDNDFSSFHNRSYDHHDHITKFSNYFMRLLNFSDMPQENKSRLFGLISAVDKMIDKARHASERVNEMDTISPKIKKYLKEIFELFLGHFDIILKKNYSIEELESFIKKRYSVVNKVNKEKFNDEELRVISECKLFMDIIVDFSETYVALNIDKYIEE